VAKFAAAIHAHQKDDGVYCIALIFVIQPHQIDCESTLYWQQKNRTCMNAIFTIVAKNYIGLAQVLETAVQQHSDAHFFIIVADEWKQGEKPTTLSANVLTARECLSIDAADWASMAFKYNLVEFCTAIKPAAFQYFFSNGYEKIIYFDPDIMVFNPLQPVFDQLNDAAITVTPHILNPQTPFKGNYADYLFLLNGTFNLGFLGLKQTSTTIAFLTWWHHRLLHHCFFDNDRGTATDQKWINLLPALFPQNEYHVSRHRGMNAAPWNFHERKVLLHDGQFLVQDREDANAAMESLLFVHFSGYDYSQIGSGQVVHKSEQMTNYDDLQPVFDAYGEKLAQSQFAQFVSLGYAYNTFDNGVGISSLQRRIFRRLLEEGKTFAQPFSTGEGSYFQLLKSKGLLDYSPVSADKMSNKTLKNFDSKLGYVHHFFRVIKKLVGVRKYSIMIRFFRRFFAEENQAFLVTKDLPKKLQ
jgi:hypothetical protein